MILLVCTFFQSSKLKLIVVISTQIDDITSQYNMSNRSSRTRNTNQVDDSNLSSMEVEQISTNDTSLSHTNDDDI